MILVPGVYDCITNLEKQGFLCRHEHLGFDRHGRKFWFINRRIFIEDEVSGEVWYYSSSEQLKLLLSKLDMKSMERALCSEIEDLSEEIERQMAITEALTNKFKGNKKSFLEIENQNILKKLKEKEEKGIENDTDKNRIYESSIQEDYNEQKTIEKEVSTTDKSKDGDLDSNETFRNNSKNIVSTRLKTGSLTPRNYSTDDLKKKNMSKEENDLDTRMTRLKNLNLNCPFKLGHEQTFKSYVNQYATNVYALNKPQRNEDRDKKRPLSHKFSLTQASEFKWSGILNGNRNNAIQTLRQTIISLEQAISTPYMHSNWPSLKKLWLQTISHCSKPADFAKVLVIFEICTKNCIYVNAWHEQLAHIKLERITSIERDEKKKIEKREKRERDDEEERNRLAINFVKYPLGQRHQVAKQKGEEYRIHGQWSWIWSSYGRRYSKNRAAACHRIEPVQIITQIEHNETKKIVSLEPVTFNYLKTKDHDIPIVSNIPTELHKTSVIPVLNNFDNINISGALTAENRLLYPKIAKKSILDDLLKRRLQLKNEEEQRLSRDNEADVNSTTNIGNKSKGRKPTEIEKVLRRLCGIKGNTTLSNNTNNTIQQHNVDTEFVNEVADSIISARDKFAQLNRLGKQYKCYLTCESNDVCYSLQQMKKNVCYSPLCLQKTRVKEELLKALKTSASHGDVIKEKIMKIVNRKPENKMCSSQTKIIDSSVNPVKLHRNFLHALEKSTLTNIDRDINEYIVHSTYKEEHSNTLESCKMELDDDSAYHANRQNDNISRDIEGTMKMDLGEIQDPHLSSSGQANNKR